MPAWLPPRSELRLVIHAALDVLQPKAGAVQRGPTRVSIAAAMAAFVASGRMVRSHSGYEEAQLAGALGMHGVGI